MIQRVLTMALLTAALAACGGENEPGDGAGGGGGTDTVEGPSCEPEFTPCGGDPIGVWTYQEVCGALERLLDLVPGRPACEDIPAVTTWDRLDGRVEFRADGTVEGATSFEYTTTLDIPVECLEDIANGELPAMCGSVGRMILGENPGGCTWEADDRCHCTLGIVDEDSFSATWTRASDTTITVGEKTFDFCVADGHLARRADGLTHLFSAGTDGGGGSGGSGPGEAPVCDEGFTACGGDPTGLWNYDQSCDVLTGAVDLSETVAVCRDLPLTVETKMEGQVYFRADGALFENFDLEEINEFDVPVACLAELAAGVPAAQACDALGNGLKNANDYLGGCFWQSGDVCHCELVRDEDLLGVNSTWTVDGGTLTEAAVGSFEFCVQDDYLVRRNAIEAGKQVHVLARTR